MSALASLSFAFIATLGALYVLAIGLVIAALCRWGEYEEHGR